MMPILGIAGRGWVGKSVQRLFPDALVYDPSKWEYNNPRDLEEADIIFICVPTNLIDGDLNTAIVEETVERYTPKLFVIRSTVPPGTTDRLREQYQKAIVMQPEYLGETPNHPLTDEKRSQFLIIGGEPAERQQLIELYQTVYNANTTMREVSAFEAELIKLAANRAGAFKVAQCQELYDVCQAMKLNYNTIREAVYGDDPRHTLWWTFVHPNKRGYGSSKCYRKDIPAFIAAAKRAGVEPSLTLAMDEADKQYRQDA